LTTLLASAHARSSTSKLGNTKIRLHLALLFFASPVFNAIMPAAQQLLLPDPRPLVERLGGDFFRQIPTTPGVYFMHDRAGTVLYVGKAKSLRRRLASYRVANPDRLPRRTLRLLGLVARIDWEECADERSAIERESQLLLALKPRFNRAGVWRGPKKFVVWRCTETALELGITEHPEADWRALGPFGSASVLRAVLVRLLWAGLHPERGMTGMPSGWFHGVLEEVTILPADHQQHGLLALLDTVMSRRSEQFSDWIRARMLQNPSAFDHAAVESDLEFLNDFFQNSLNKALLETSLSPIQTKDNEP
jgi:predicted GIY-YIG superfamily endonuclease